jgi:hypothetical protein
MAVGFLALGLVLALTLGIQYLVVRSQPGGQQVSEPIRLGEIFTKESFLYGPQAWRPYAYKLSIFPGADINGNDGYYVMFVDLNATFNLTVVNPNVKVSYSFQGLQGNASFSVYGYAKSNGGISWTNREDGYGASGFYVTGLVGPKFSYSSLSNAKTMTDVNHIYVRVSNIDGPKYNDFSNGTYWMKFEKPGGGLNNMHLSTDPKVLYGEITYTNSTNGSFFITYTGDRVLDDLILMVAVRGAISDNFELVLKSSTS